MSKIISNLESPENKSYIEDLVVEGWAFSDESLISEISVFVGGQNFSVGSFIPREDVFFAYPSFGKKSLNSGFRLEVRNLGSPSYFGRTSIRVLIKSSDGVICEHIRRINTENKISFPGKEILSIFFQFLKKTKRPANFSQLKRYVRSFWVALKNRSLNTESQIFGIEKYGIWCARNSLNSARIDAANQNILLMDKLPLISIVMPTYKTKIKYLVAAIESVRAQIYKNWELCISDDNSESNQLRAILERYSSIDSRIKILFNDVNSHISIATNKAVEITKGEFLFFMDHDDLLTPDALYEVASAINEDPNVDVIYSDDDKIRENGERFDPQFKPDWSPELLLSYMYISHIFVVRKSLFSEVGGLRKGFEGSQDYDLALRLSEKTDRIVHIAKILYHWRVSETSTAMSTDSKPYSVQNGIKALEEAVERRRFQVVVDQPDFAKKLKIGIFSLKPKLKDTPLVSILIPSKNNFALIHRCINSIISLSSYTNYEIVVIDNDSHEEDVLKYYRSENKIRTIHVPNRNGKFSFSNLINEGVRAAKGNYLIFLNNDTEVISPGWIEEMLVYALRDDIGAVGAKLLYPDGSVQHAGVVLKMLSGLAGHIFKHIPDWHGGYLSYANVVRNYSAVTAACMMTKRQTFEDVKGMDEVNFNVAYNDVDYCMKINAMGKRVVYTPYAKLYHHEGKTRGGEHLGNYDNSDEERDMYLKWCKIDDKYYNTNLSLRDESSQIEPFSLVYPKLHRKIRVLFITHNLNFEGAPLFVYNLARSIDPTSFEPVIWSPVDGVLRSSFESAGIQCIVDGSLNIAERIGEFTKNGKIREFDLLFCNTILNYWGVEIGKILRIPSVFAIHESILPKDTMHKIKSKKLRQCFAQSFRTATKVTFVADATQRMYSNFLYGNGLVIRNGIDIDRIERFKKSTEADEIRKSLHISYDEFVVSIVGTICYRKGQKDFAQAAKLLLETGRKAVFIIAGGVQTACYQEVVDFISENNLGDQFRIITNPDEVYSYYYISNAFVCASYEESSPMTILESMAFNVPVITTDVFGIPEIVRNNREALFVKPGSPLQIKEKIEYLIENPTEAAEIARNARNRLVVKFDYTRFISDYQRCMVQAYFESSNTFINI